MKVAGMFVCVAIGGGGGGVKFYAVSQIQIIFLVYRQATSNIARLFSLSICPTKDD